MTNALSTRRLYKTRLTLRATPAARLSRSGNG
ncbi:hypothetical protein C8D72_0094 [Kushneria indalinina DSM 14324]|uniref:Uncharacterized protein n=1 Tax=Kushneria indalinina DSM 14324 TaxID=1122140 RepID=A0A3D9DYM7_9GAMM|nr:hypothetical protein C8D72_0094 [Kushneria indalinina DSM 14324]